MVITDYGEAAIEYEGMEYVFRPSFFNISQIGTPEEIVRCLAAVNGATFTDLMNKLANAEMLTKHTLPLIRRKQILGEILSSAILIMSCCCKDDISHLIGYYKPGKKGLVYVRGVMPQEHIISIARSLIRHGVVGDVKSREKGEYTSKFIASDFVSLALAHFNITELEAWNMTMTSFRKRMLAKYPPQDEGISSEKHDEMMAWREKVEAARRKREKENG